MQRSFFAKLKDEDDDDGDVQREEPTVVQSEGWLLMKRGPGITKPESSVHRGTTAAAPPPEMRASVDDDAVSVFQSAPPPKARKSRIGSIVAKLKGTEETRRYFVLLTTRAQDGRGGTSTIRTPRAELRYYKQKPTPPDNFANPAGTIQLQTNMEHQLRDGVIRLFTREKSFMFRIDPEDMNPARARTALSQWLHAIQFSLGALATFSHQRKTAGGRFQPINVHPLHSPDAAVPPILPAEYETRRKARKSVSKREDGVQQSTNNNDGEEGGEANPFVELWEFYGIDGYDAVIDHFGPARTDLERLLGHFTSRAAQFQSEVQILESQLGHSTEIVVKEQRTIAYAMRELHKTNERNLHFAKLAMKDMNQHVVQDIAQTLQEMSSRLEDIETKCETSVNYIHGAKRVLLEADERVARLTALVAANAQQSAAAAKVPSTRRKSDATPEKLEFDLNGARQARRDASQTLVTIEAKCAETITDAMISCYELEMFRFNSVQRIMQAAAKLETMLESRKAVETPLEMALNAIDAPRDMRYTFAKLKAMGEKTRPNGRMRRKNSTVNRVLLDLMPDEEEEESEEEEDNQRRAQYVDEWLAL